MAVTPEQIREYKEKLAQYNKENGTSARCFEAVPTFERPFTWYVAPVVDKVGEHGEPYEGGTVFLRQRRGGRAIQELPVDFFAHELMDLKADCDDEVIALVEEWGLPFSPLRRAPAYHFGYDPAIIGELVNAQKLSIAGEPRMGTGSENYQAGGFESLQECRLTLALLQKLVGDLLSSIRGENKTEAPYDVLGIACHPMNVANPYYVNENDPYGQIGYQSLGLTTAICNQLAAALQDHDMPWRECPVCGKTFKYQRPRKGAKRAFTRSIALYCSTKCSDTAGTRRRRKKRADTPPYQAGGDSRNTKR